MGRQNDGNKVIEYVYEVRRASDGVVVARVGSRAAALFECKLRRGRHYTVAVPTN